MDFDKLIISLIDCEVNKGLYKKEIARKLGLTPTDISDVWLESELNNGVVTQYLYISFSGRVKKEVMDKFDYSFIDGYNIVIEVGDTIL